MKITILNKKEARDYIPSGTAVIIRLEDEGTPYKLKGTFKDELFLTFSDVEDGEYAISKDDISQIKAFAQKYKTIDEFVINCNYGKGRSPAVGAYISYRYNIQFDFKQYPDLNQFVLNSLLKK